MHLDERSNLILKRVVSNPGISNAELERKYHLSRRQISYSFTKINDWLKSNNYPKIQRTNGGKFIIDPLLMELFAEKVEHSAGSYIPSEKERAQLVLLMLLGSEEELSLLHFSSSLSVSKNTVLRDMKYTQKIVNGYHLEIIYSRMHGYDIVGSEWNKRKLLIEVLRTVYDMYQGETYIQAYTGISREEIQRLKEQMEKVEKRLALQFIDQKIKLLPYTIAILLKRIKKGNLIKDSYHIDYEELSDTKEFEAAEILIEDAACIPKEERLFITLQLLTSNVLSSQFLREEETLELKSSLKNSLALFEKKACITFKEKEKLLQKLVLHMKPAYYRIKYQLTTNYSIIEKVSEEFEAIHYIVKDSLKPFETYIGCSIPESEVMFITVFIGGHLINSGETIQLKKRAVVVCPNGVSISHLMEHTLRDLFPEFYFYEALSIREFEQSKAEFDMVFSPVTVQTSKHLFIVEQFISDFQKLQLRQRVIQTIFGLNTSVVNIEQLISVIEKYAKVEQKSQLQKALQDYFSLQILNETSENQEYSLADLITPETIVLRDQVESWKEAISIAAAPLLHKGVITEAYIDKMQEQYPSMSPHIVLRLNVAIPHASPEDGVQAVGMSLLKLKEGLLCGEQKVHFIVVIAAIDKKKHLNAMLQLMKLAEMNGVINEMKQLNEKYKIYEIIKTHSI
ncbi:BglG family transcription antiterminator [Priestia megaterium]|jgi:transcriptional antiterminator/mannitol/fructose-specific phosphotransferase system IIA component (Ntr-type)|uniref:Ascorbate-specific PTS system EIIA component n=1 Tax=Priestia megaterium (strain ATCC 14581 / DSM 32 / CCUG 1817 / JCM 2506 / NBRC 15308 / NCIMB 9376 / NCTC 10342 / NRRL B-14308 / VKM B-512 / Ford 19) TaxID=1348623 RepID=A0A0B6AKG5_PRIM2|nr:BglG family transcription antiterminator [Priestia megaterium]AJI20299.1 PRD domain protein [Priestia megaterium NBRC 15308 = ATCC 14581]KFN05425.1 PRD domain protein [Priestia megaterium]KGJ77418.1 PTS sugar transporter subunit IIA [Priestia megaterium NBRC 15308 = ATCC 14581]MDR4229984.1 BglG family transcription antiterminator [Priestia megaterium]MED3810080.1 BglG family transcription antiterminator [Priestia megaterium]